MGYVELGVEPGGSKIPGKQEAPRLNRDPLAERHREADIEPVETTSSRSAQSPFEGKGHPPNSTF